MGIDREVRRWELSGSRCECLLAGQVQVSNLIPFDVLPGERQPHVCSVGPAFIQRHVAGTRVRVRSLIIMHVGMHYVMFIIGEDSYLAMF